MNKDEFTQILGYTGLGGDQNLIDKLFWVFDDDGNGEVDYKELIVGLEMFKDTSLEEKLGVYFELCDTQGIGDIEEQDLYNVLKINITAYEDRQILRHALRDLWKATDKKNLGTISKEELMQIITKEGTVRNIIEKNIEKCKAIDSWIENDLQKPFQTRINFGAGSPKSNTVWFPYMNKLTQAIKEKEAAMDKINTMKQEAIVVLRRLRGKDEFESSESEDEGH